MGCLCAKKIITIKTLQLLALCGLLSSMLMVLCGIAAAFVDRGYTTSAYGAPIWSGFFVVILWIAVLRRIRNIKVTPSFRYVLLEKYLTSSFTLYSFLLALLVLICFITAPVRLIQKDKCLDTTYSIDTSDYRCLIMPTELGSAINLLVLVLALVNIVLLIATGCITSHNAKTMITKDFGDEDVGYDRPRRQQTLNLAMAPPYYVLPPPSYSEAIASTLPQPSDSSIVFTRL